MKKIDGNGITLSEQEMNLFFRIRSLKDAVVEITLQDKLPVTAKINIRGLYQRITVGTYPITPEEKLVIEWIRNLGYGKLILIVREGIPTIADYNSFVSWRLDKEPDDVIFAG